MLGYVVSFLGEGPEGCDTAHIEVWGFELDSERRNPTLVKQGLIMEARRE